MSNATFSTLHIVPEGRAMLACSCLVPDEWVQVPIPEDDYDFTNSAVFFPLLLCMAPYGAVVFTIGARPSFDDGTVQDWAEYLAGVNNIQLESIKQARVNRIPGIVCEGTMNSDAGMMRSRSVFIEDGGRLFNVGTLAPETIWASVEPIFNKLLGAFALEEIKGLTAQPMRLMTSESPIEFASAPAANSGTTAPEAAATSTPTSTSIGDAAPDASTTDSSNGADADADADAGFAPNDRPTQPADVALSDDASSFDQDNEMNARMRDNGVGLVPRIFMTSTREKFVTVGAAAIEQMFRVPFGWHIIDDGKRTLIFDAGGLMQINVDLRPATPDQHTLVLQGIGDALAASNPDALFLKLEMMGMPCLAVRDLLIGGERLDQGYLIRESGRPDMAIVCRVTGDREHFTFAMNTAEVVLTSLQGAPPVEDEFAGQPDWWRNAVLLERQDKLEEAEKVILAALNHIGVYSQLAYMYEQRLARLRGEHRNDEATDAKNRAISWLRAYAGSATSGGEGEALSYERDQRIAALG